MDQRDRAPEKPVGKVAVAMAPSNPDRIIAMFETGDGILGMEKRPKMVRSGRP